MHSNGAGKRATSAGYRFPQATAKISRRPADKQRKTETHQSTWGLYVQDAVIQDHAWREFIRTEEGAVKDWQMKWSFLLEYDQLSNPRTQTTLPSRVPVSDFTPNTSNQVFGSRLHTDIGQSLIRMDNMMISHRKTRMESGMDPC